jgi:hypothetical protein
VNVILTQKPQGSHLQENITDLIKCLFLNLSFLSLFEQTSNPKTVNKNICQVLKLAFREGASFREGPYLFNGIPFIQPLFIVTNSRSVMKAFRNPVADNLHAPTHRVLIPYVLDELDKL